MIIPILLNITKKQTTLALVAVVFATAMVVGTFATVADNSAFARHHHHGHHHSGSSSSSQTISQNSNTAQTSNCISPGGAGGTSGSAMNGGMSDLAGGRSTIDWGSTPDR